MAFVVPPAYSLVKTAKMLGYGTAGFRDKADILAPAMYRVGILAALRSKLLSKKVGVMITASHNPEPDNGAKVVDPMGEMLEVSWEALATTVANCPDADLDDTIARIVKSEGIPSDAAASVVVARDTRPSGPGLMAAVIAGVEAVQKDASIDAGVLTTPQLHFMVRCYNDPAYGTPTVQGYVDKFSRAFRALFPEGAAAVHVKVDCANGVGAPHFATLCASLAGVLDATICNDGTTGRLNDGCGADHVKTTQSAPKGMGTFEPNELCASFDGDADRLMFFFRPNESDDVTILDGDRIAIVCALFLNELLSASGLTDLKLGVVQTAYANGGSTQHLAKLGIPTACAKTGVKHLHHLAQEYDVGVYFEANGHGTILFSDAAVAAITAAAAAPDTPVAARDLSATVDLINQTVGDAVSDLLLVLIVLTRQGMDARAWAALYADLPNQLRKVVIRDRSVVQVTNAERTCTAPPTLQPKIDAAVAKRTNARSFVRASGTEDVVRVYAEAATAEEAASLASEVCGLVYELCDGVGEPPK